MQRSHVVVLLLFIVLICVGVAFHSSQNQQRLQLASPATTPSPILPTIRYKTFHLVCFGDSNTQGFSEFNYPFSLAHHWAVIVSSVKNIGSPNSALSRPSAKHAIWNRPIFKAAFSRETGQWWWSGADVVTVMFGTNDARDKIWRGAAEFRECYQRLVRRILEYSSNYTGEEYQRRRPLHILLLTPPPVVGFSGKMKRAMNTVGSDRAIYRSAQHAESIAWRPTLAISRYRLSPERLIEVASLVRQLAEEFEHTPAELLLGLDSKKRTRIRLIRTVKFGLVDVFSAMSSAKNAESLIGDDGIHLSEDGVKMVTSLIGAKLSQF